MFPLHPHDASTHLALAYSGLMHMLDARGFPLSQEDETWLGLYDDSSRRTEKAAWITRMSQTHGRGTPIFDKTFTRTCVCIPHEESVDVCLMNREETDALGVTHFVPGYTLVRTPTAHSLGIPLEFSYVEHLHVVFILFAKDDDEKYKACQMEILGRHQQFMAAASSSAPHNDWCSLPTDFHRVLLVTDTEKYRKEIREFGRTHGYETWTTSELILDASRHMLNSAFPTILAPEASVIFALATSFIDPMTGVRHPFPQTLTSVSQLPSRTTDDPVVRYLGGWHGDVLMSLDYIRIGMSSPHLDTADWFVVRDRDHFTLPNLHPKRVAAAWIRSRLSQNSSKLSHTLTHKHKSGLGVPQQANAASREERVEDVHEKLVNEDEDEDELEQQEQDQDDEDYDVTVGSSSLHMEGGHAGDGGVAAGDDDDDAQPSTLVHHRRITGSDGEEEDDDEEDDEKSSDGGFDGSDGEYDQYSGGDDD